MDKFRVEVGRVIIIGAVAYCVLLTIGLIIGTIFKCELSQPVRDMLVIILTWMTTKAGTVVDHEYGGSAGSDKKTDFMMKEAKGERQERDRATLASEPDPDPDTPEFLAGVRRQPAEPPAEPGPGTSK